VDDADQARIERDLRTRLAKPRYPAIFYLPQAYEKQSPDPIQAPPKDSPRCTSVARSERDLGGNRGGMGGVVREPISCALEAGHGGPHKSRSFPIPLSKLQSHWEWSDSPAVETGSDGVPEDAAEMGPAAIATFSGRVFDGNNQGIQWTDVSARASFADLWRHAGLRFRAACLVSAIVLIVGMVFLVLFLDDPKWQFIVVFGVAYVLTVFGAVLAGQVASKYQRLLKSAGRSSSSTLTSAECPAPKSRERGGPFR
jgi:hypothetical protein